MHWLLERLSPVLRLSRVSTAFAVVANAWFVILWTRHETAEATHAALLAEPLWLLLASSAANALGLFGFGMALNDILDLRRDRALKPDRPLASGAAGMDTAVMLVTSALIVAVLGATPFGIRAVLMTILLAGAILVFNGAARFVPAFGFVSYGLIYSGHMLVPNSHLSFLVPVWLVFTLMTAISAAAHVLGRKMPPVSSRAWLTTVAGWSAWSAALVWLGWSRNKLAGGFWPGWVRPACAAWVGSVLIVLVWVAWRKANITGRGPRMADKLTRYGVLAMSFCCGAWMFGNDNSRDGLVLTGLAAAGYLGMTVLRELYALVEQPLGFRR